MVIIASCLNFATGTIATFMSWSRAALKNKQEGLLPEVQAIPITSDLGAASLLVSAGRCEAIHGLVI